MNKTKIEWCTDTWNPVTGCLHGCPYCYAAGVARRFGDNLPDQSAYHADHPQLHTLDRAIGHTPYPWGFEPTLHAYRLEEPARAIKGRDIFVCSMADLFGRWVPTDWITAVLDACRRGPQHRYLFLTKNPMRYFELDHLALLPRGDNFWYGATVTDGDTVTISDMRERGLNIFWSMEPLLGPVDLSTVQGLPAWVIVGAETGRRQEKVIPERGWVDQIATHCRKNEVPVFYKSNLRDHFGDLPESAFPWDKTGNA